MKRIVYGWLWLLCFVYASGAISQTPGSIVVRGEPLANGCLADLNDAQALKKTGLCSFAIIAPGVKLTDLACNSLVSEETDTVINCTYSPIKKLAIGTPPNEKAGTILLSSQGLTNGCFTQVNLPVLRCGFNIVLIGVAIPNMSLSSKVGGGNTTLEASYAPVTQ